jgi:hypothetical protein
VSDEHEALWCASLTAQRDNLSLEVTALLAKDPVAGNESLSERKREGGAVDHAAQTFMQLSVPLLPYVRAAL